jgi:hypothetical protein
MIVYIILKMEDYNPNDFNKKFNEFNAELPGRMYIFEITKFCGYSTLVYMYKDETITDLYNRVSHHFGCKNIKGLYIDNHLYKYIDDAKKNELSNNNADHRHYRCCHSKQKEWCIPIPVSSLITIKEFVFDNTAKEPRNLEPIYPLPTPVVYRIYLDDGHCHVC